MNCKCKEEIEARLLEKFKADMPDITDHEVSLSGYSFMYGKDNTLTHRPVAPIKHTYTHTYKNGKTKKITKEISFALSHCPHCGAKVK